jgi:hypothetical protein
MNVPIKAGSLFLLFGHLDSSEVGQIKESPGADQNGTKLRAVWDVFRSEAKGDRIQKPHDRLSGKVSLAGANKIQSGRLCYFTQSCGCRGFPEIAPGCPCEIARHSGKQCSIGFPPVSIRTIGDAFQVFAVSDLLMFREYHANSGESKFLDLCPRRIVLSGRHNLLSGG